MHWPLAYTSHCHLLCLVLNLVEPCEKKMGREKNKDASRKRPKELLRRCLLPSSHSRRLLRWAALGCAMLRTPRQLPRSPAGNPASHTGRSRAPAAAAAYSTAARCAASAQRYRAGELLLRSCSRAALRKSFSCLASDCRHGRERGAIYKPDRLIKPMHKLPVILAVWPCQGCASQTQSGRRLSQTRRTDEQRCLAPG